MENNTKAAIVAAIILASATIIAALIENDQGGIKGSGVPTDRVIEQPSSLESKKKQPLGEKTDPESAIPKTFDLTLVIPSQMRGATILVDDEPAIIVEDKLTTVVIRIKQKNTNHIISLQKPDMETCEKKVFVRQGGMVVTPCQ